MKELSIEQKAKAYDEVREKIAIRFGSNVAEEIFSEYEESEDERIRQFLIHEVTETSDKIMSYRNMNKKDVLAWLEKQGEQKSIDNLTQQEAMDIAVAKCFDEQKSDNKVKPKFHEGEWVTIDAWDYHIEEVSKSCYKLSDINGNYTMLPHFAIDDYYRLWTIQDAKDGDVLCSGQIIVIFKHFEDPSYRQHIVAYIGLDTSGNIQITDGIWTLGIDKAKPATKEQRELLFQKMKEAGYTFDFKKKKLKKIEKEVNGEDYGIDSLYHAQRILEKTLGSVDGYQSDDGILEHKCAISAVKKLYEQNPWSEEDELHIRELESLVKQSWAVAEHKNDKDTIHKMSDLSFFLKTLKPQPKQEWSEEDRKIIIELIGIFESAIDGGHVAFPYRLIKDYIRVLKSCLPQNTWKPSKEQMDALLWCVAHLGGADHRVLGELYEHLKKLREE